MRPIDADALLDGGIRVKCGFNDGGMIMIPLGDVRQSIKDAPTLEMVPVIHGRWESYEEVVDGELCISPNKHVCSACKDIWESSRRLPHCPSCGAIMDLED